MNNSDNTGAAVVLIGLAFVFGVVVAFTAQGKFSAGIDNGLVIDRASVDGQYYKYSVMGYDFSSKTNQHWAIGDTLVLIKKEK